MADRQLAVVKPHQELAEVPRTGLQTIEQDRRALWQQLFFEGATDADIEFCVAFCAHRDLDPLRGEVVFTKFAKREKVNGRWQDVGYTITPVVTAIGHRVQASRTGDYLGQTPREWCGKDGVWKQVWLEDDPPAAARVGILRRGCPQPIYAVAVFKRFAKKNYEGTELTGLWKTHPDVMIATRAETAAFKLAFPETRRQDATPSRIVYRDAGEGKRFRTMDGALAIDGGEVFEDLAIAESIADRDHWSDANRELHALIAELHPEEPDTHALVHEIVCARYGVQSTKDASVDDLEELIVEFTAMLPKDDDEDDTIIEAEAQISYGGDHVEDDDGYQVVVPEKVIRQWVDNIGRADSVRKFAAIEKTIFGQELDRVPAISNALGMKRGELGIPDDDAQMAATDRAIARNFAP